MTPLRWLPLLALVACSSETYVTNVYTIDDAAPAADTSTPDTASAPTPDAGPLPDTYVAPDTADTGPADTGWHVRCQTEAGVFVGCNGACGGGSINFNVDGVHTNCPGLSLDGICAVGDIPGNPGNCPAGTTCWVGTFVNQYQGLCL